MDKIIERGMLFDFYGELLTEHQQRIYSEAVFDDLSLAEVSEVEGISRQGVHDIIKRCDKLLEGYEERLKLIERFQNIKAKISSIDEIIDKTDNASENFKSEVREALKTIYEDL